MHVAMMLCLYANRDVTTMTLAYIHNLTCAASPVSAANLQFHRHATSRLGPFWRRRFSVEWDLQVCQESAMFGLGFKSRIL